MISANEVINSLIKDLEAKYDRIKYYDDPTYKQDVLKLIEFSIKSLELAKEAAKVTYEEAYCHGYTDGVEVGKREERGLN